MNYRGFKQYNDLTILILIAINVVLFIIQQARPDLVQMLDLTTSKWTSEPWTLITCVFMHAGYFHIIFNMLALYFLGSYLCRLVGDRWFLAIYLIGGIAGSFLFILLGDGIVVGASGAIFAVGGAFAVIAPQLRIIIFPIPAPVPLWAAMIGIFIILTVIPMASPGSAIAWQAHLGGFIVGLALGYYLRRWRRANLWQSRFMR